jgi:cytochrome b561/polyisoprenoid-binding protein YceI
LQPQRFHPVARYLHWLIAAAVVLQFLLANLAGNAETPLEELALLANHKSVGITIFLLAVLRLAWRVWQGVPRALPMPDWQFIASQISHWSMYALIFLLPITGWLTSSASAHSVSWFNLVALPDLIAPDPELREKLEEIHELHATLLLVIVLVHMAAALAHSLRKDRALARITSTGAIIAFVATVTLGSVTLTRVGSDAGDVHGTGMPLGATMPTRGTTDLAAWNIDYEASQIAFTATQAGAGVKGEWQQWRADLHFDESRVDAGLFDVSVVVASVETHDDDRDDMLQDTEWFDSENYPEVGYFASRFTRNTEGHYEALGALTVKGRTFPVNLRFTVSRDTGTFVLDGTAKLDRLALDLGTGEWSDTSWIGRFVTVNVHVEASAVN